MRWTKSGCYIYEQLFYSRVACCGNYVRNLLYQDVCSTTNFPILSMAC